MTQFLQLALLLASLNYSQAVRGNEGLIVEPDILYRQLISGSAYVPSAKLDHLLIGYRSENKNLGFHWRLIYDSLHQVKANWLNIASLNVHNLPPRTSYLNDYGLGFNLDSSTELSLEKWSGSTLLPDASGIAFAHALQDTSWDQSVIRLTWSNNEYSILAASLVLGLGEGARLKARDTKPYSSLLTRIAITPSLSFQIAWSYDANFLSPSSLPWLEPSQRGAAADGFTVERQAMSLLLDGNHPKMRGLRLSMGWQGQKIQGPGHDLAQNRLSTPLTLEPTEVLGESLGSLSRISRETYASSGSYQILGTYILSFHWQRFQAKLRNRALFTFCKTIDKEGQCLGINEQTSSLRVNGMGYGIGKIQKDKWNLLLESFQESYDRLYRIYHFAPNRDRRRKELKLLQIRLTYQF